VTRVSSGKAQHEESKRIATKENVEDTKRCELNTRRELGFDQFIHIRPVTKEVTVMNVGTRSKVEFRVKDAPRVPYRITAMCSTKPGLNRRRSKQHDKVEAARTRGFWNRNKPRPRPILMDMSKITVNSNRNIPS